MESPHEIQTEQWLKLRYQASEMRVAEIFRRLSGINVDALLIKGLAAARYYPESWRRFFSDVDICVSIPDSEKIPMIRKSLVGLGVDIHAGFRNLDEHDWNLISDRAEEFEIDGVIVRAPCREDHFRILATHWLNDGGRRADKLLDLHYCVESAFGAFDWELCLEGITSIRRNWIGKAVGAVEKIIGKKVSGHPFTESETSLPEWFLKTVELESSREEIRPIALSGSASVFIAALRTKFPPNPIQATIEAKCEFRDGIPRVAQLRSLLGRTIYFVNFFVLKRR
jgi:hypothetical protein